jgi:predicted O-methyltransferase YrrM
VGAFAIEHRNIPAGDRVAVVSMREAITTGKKPIDVILDKPLRIHALTEDGGTWMTDSPEELRQAGEWLASVRPKGRVLVAGLGLGIVATWLSKLALVTQVDVVEIQPDVIRLLAAHQAGYRVSRSDIMAYLKLFDRWTWPYDYCFLDTWQGTGEATWWDTVMPMRRVIANRFGKQKVHAWAEDIMLGQVAQSIRMGNASSAGRLATVFPEIAKKSLLSAKKAIEEYGLVNDVVVSAGGRCWLYEKFPPEMSEEDIAHFTGRVGLPDWEKRWAKYLP